MKLALCLEYPLGQFGGTEVLVQELVKGLHRKHEIVLVSGDSAESFAKSPWAGMVHAQIPWHMHRARAEDGAELARELARQNVDLAHFHFGGSYGWGNRRLGVCPTLHVRRRGIACLSTNHGVFALNDGYCAPQRSDAIKLALLPPAWLGKLQQLASVNAEVTVSQHDFRRARAHYFPMRDKFVQIYHSRLHGEPPRQEGEREKRIVCVGTIGLRKGQPFLVAAFEQVAAKYPDWKLELIGRCGNEAMGQELQRMMSAPSLAGRVTQRVDVSDAEVTRLFADSEIFVMPSLAEGLGLSLQEALFYGCACIASRAGGMQDLVTDGENGLQTAPGSVPELAAALDRLMGDSSLREKFREAGPKSVLEKEMTADKMIEKYERQYVGLSPVSITI